MEEAASRRPARVVPGSAGDAARRKHAPDIVRMNVSIEPEVRGFPFQGVSRFSSVQALVLQARGYSGCRRSGWITRDRRGGPLPGASTAIFGPHLRRFVLAQYHQGQVTVAADWSQLLDAIRHRKSPSASGAVADRWERQLREEARECVLRAGLNGLTG